MAISASETGATARKIQVLVADDEPGLRAVIGEFLELLDFCNFAEANDGVEALEYLRSYPIDCILSDVRMPRMDLEELLPKLRTEFPNLIILASSGYSDVENAYTILEMGAHEFLAKPLDLDLLEQTLEWVHQRADILALAGELFGAGASEGLNWPDAFDALGRALAHQSGPFAPRMLHAGRTADLVDIVLGDAEESERRELKLAALVHEIGVSSHHLLIIETARSIQAGEARLVRTSALIGARLLQQVLPDRPLVHAVEHHMHWLEMDDCNEGGGEGARTAACQLGVLNAVDGLLHDRADRPASKPDHVREYLETQRSETEASVVDRTLAAWKDIESYYAEAGGQ